MNKTDSSPFSTLKSSSTYEEKVEFAYTMYNKLYKHFKERADKNKKFYQLYKYSSILLAATTTIVTSLEIIFTDSFPPWVLPIVSAGSTVAVAFLGASGVQKNWINSRTTQQRLQTEQFLFNQQADHYEGLDKNKSIQLFSKRLMKVWNEGHGQWEQNVSDSKNQT